MRFSDSADSDRELKGFVTVDFELSIRPVDASVPEWATAGSTGFVLYLIYADPPMNKAKSRLVVTTKPVNALGL
jgi:hypothetical protein